MGSQVVWFKCEQPAHARRLDLGRSKFATLIGEGRRRRRQQIEHPDARLEDERALERAASRYRPRVRRDRRNEFRGPPKDSN